ncbi:hypothetical protein HX788_21690 [Pseudomonas edaphica]|uniref:Uncharacterized protein n=1 Tax=Pseudomonas edaphica TaxID=2006980 RepID=A0A7Y8JKW8_9PSED|nr:MULTISPECIES: hypothetical protein [Pseudomonas]MBI6947605.1 hypothetical protein [Pseudomonas koreensis]NWC47134.1 hypothetical protein [Pseudomonas sp. IPO3747]NWE09724.1 hypothetical protein [Pseudomonas edaphica]NWE80798.1 hypothetical protein [Pseudomonas edaphica]
MRVPIHPDDLNPKYGFKRIAKKLQREWPGFSPIQLSFAREILSKGLGYRDYYDVVQSSKKWQPQAVPSFKEEVNVALMSAISAAIRVDNTFVTPHSNLLALVRSLPLHTLVALRGDQSDKAGDYPLLETSNPYFNISLSVAFVATNIGFCSHTFHGEPDENHWSCGICPNYIVPPSGPHMDRPTSP